MKGIWCAGVCMLFVAGNLTLAATIEGTTTGLFVNPTGPPGMIISGVGTNAIQWGSPVGTAPGSLKITGNPFTAMSEEPFLLGTLEYFNGTNVIGTAIDGIDLRITLNISSPINSMPNFIFPLTLINTPNQGTPEQQADILFLPSLFPSTIFLLDGVPHTLKMSFGVSTTGGFTEIDRFFVYENQGASGELRGVLTTDVSQVVPEPMTWGLLLTGLGIVVSIRRYC